LQVVTVCYTVEVSRRSQALNHRGGLVLGVVMGIFFVSASVEGGAVEAKGHSVNLLAISSFY
jgi:hypothetical protein